MRKELRQRLAKEYRYSANKMKEASQAPQKLFYFSAFYGESSRILNWEWNRDLALIHMATQQVHSQINTMVQSPSAQILPIDWKIIFDKLTESASELATYFEKDDAKDSETLCAILGHLAEIGYAITGNGSYLHEKGAFKL